MKTRHANWVGKKKKKKRKKERGMTNDYVHNLSDYVLCRVEISVEQINVKPSQVNCVGFGDGISGMHNIVE